MALSLVGTFPRETLDACAETMHVIGEARDDNFDDLLGKPCGGDGRAVEVSGNGPPERILRILTRPRYQTRSANGLITPVVVVVKRSDEPEE